MSSGVSRGETVAELLGIIPSFIAIYFRAPTNSLQSVAMQCNARNSLGSPVGQLQGNKTNLFC